MPYEPLPPGKYTCRLAKPAEGATCIDVTEFTDRDGNAVGGLVCNMLLDVYDADGVFLRVAYAENYRGVTLAMRKPTASYPDGLLPFNWDKLVQIFGLSSRAEVLDLERLAKDPQRGPAIMATVFELWVEHQTYSVKDSHGMATGETRTAERYTIQPLGYQPGAGGLRQASGTNRAATINRFRTLISACKAPPVVVPTAAPATPATPPPARPAPVDMPTRPAPQPPAPPTPPAAPAEGEDVGAVEAANQTRTCSAETLWALCSERWGTEAEAKLWAALDLLGDEAKGKELVDLSPDLLFEAGCNLDIGFIPF